VLHASPEFSHIKLPHLLTASCRYGDLDSVKYYIAMGADPSHNNNQCLINAIENNHIEIVKYLINECNVNAFANDGIAFFIALQPEL
jgi:hypothetical protein